MRRRHAGAHIVHLEPGGSVDEIDFGNRPILVEPGSVRGVKWLDANGNAERDSDEIGLPGVTVYSDLNRNSMLDRGEPRTVTIEDIPATDFDEGGRYRLEGLRPGRHVIREVVPEGHVQTYPRGRSADPGPARIAPNGLRGRLAGAHVVRVEPGGSVDRINFGNRPIVVEPGSVRGAKWLDANGNAEWDSDELGLPGVTIYSDLNGNGVLNRGEPRTVTMEENPATDFDEGGRYWLEGLRPGRHVIREVVPEGSVQTYPMPDVWPPNVDPDIWPWPGAGAHVVHVRPGGSVDRIDFGNRPIGSGRIHGVKWFDTDGNGQREWNEPGLAGVTIYVDLNHNGSLEPDEPHTMTMGDDPFTDIDETGRYRLANLQPGRYLVREIVPFAFEQTFPVPEDGGVHRVSVRPGQVVEGIHFGNRLATFGGPRQIRIAERAAAMPEHSRRDALAEGRRARLRQLTGTELDTVWSPARNWRA
jgi:hypothetical protein